MTEHSLVAEWRGMTEAQCPTREVLDRIGDRWTVLTVGALGQGPLRFNQIERSVAGISQKMLTQTLRGLERDGLVLRTVYPEVPPRVVYELTSEGRTLLAPLAALQAWATGHIGGVLEARQKYDTRA
jgi:DNA-binding HxlR family transcriptional regulator